MIYSAGLRPPVANVDKNKTTTKTRASRPSVLRYKRGPAWARDLQK